MKTFFPGAKPKAQCILHPSLLPALQPQRWGDLSSPGPSTPCLLWPLYSMSVSPLSSTVPQNKLVYYLQGSFSSKTHTLLNNYHLPLLTPPTHFKKQTSYLGCPHFSLPHLIQNGSSQPSTRLFPQKSNPMSLFISYLTWTLSCVSPCWPFPVIWLLGPSGVTLLNRMNKLQATQGGESWTGRLSAQEGSLPFAGSGGVVAIRGKIY